VTPRAPRKFAEAHGRRLIHANVDKNVELFGVGDSMLHIRRLFGWRAATGAASLLVVAILVISYTDAVLSLRLHELNVVFHRRTVGTISLAFKPDITQLEVEKAVTCLDRC
jgi:hypothetical protein